MTLPQFRHRRLLLPGSASFSPLELFSNGESGAWYDPSDLTTMFQDYAGTAAAVDSPVKLMLDKSQGELHSLGSEKWVGASASIADFGGSNGTWDSGTGVFANTSVGTNSGYPRLSLGGSLTVGRWYRVEFEATGDIEDASLQVDAGAFYEYSGGTAVLYQRADNASFEIKGDGTKTWSVTITSVSVKEIPGNHAYQDTDSKRPMLRQSGGLYYLEFDGVDDALDIADTDALDFGQGSFFALAGLRITVEAWQVVWGKTDSTAGDNIRLFVNSTRYPRVFWGNNAEGYVVANAPLTLDQDYVVKWAVDAPNTKVKYRIDDSKSESLITLSGTGSNATVATIGRDLASQFSEPFRLYGLLLRKGTLPTDAEEDSAVKFLAQKSGVTL